MKTCPHCHSEVEEGFDLCWNCNYSFTEDKVVDIKDETVPGGDRVINCLRCHILMNFAGEFKFHEGASLGVLGNLFELFVNKESFDLYACPQCGKVEFFLPALRSKN